MKTTMLKVLDLRDLFTKINAQPLPVSTAYKLSKLFAAVKSEGDFYSTHLDSIIEEYGQKDDNGQYILTEDKTGVRIDQDKISEVEQKLQELWSIEVELPDVKFKLSELEKIELTVSEFNNLMPFIEE